MATIVDKTASELAGEGQESGLLPDRLSTAQAALPGPELTPQSANTQEQAWGVLAAAALGRDGRPVRVAVNGADQAPATPEQGDGNNGSSAPTTTSGTSDTPRLDALLGEQR